MTFPQPDLSPPGQVSEAERGFMDDSPPGLFPDNQDSNVGLYRKIISGFVQEIIDDLKTIYNERFPQTSDQFLDEHEETVGLPQNPSGKTLAQRRAAVLSRYRRGPFTHLMRQTIVEEFITSVFGTPFELFPDGHPLSTGGEQLFDELIPGAPAYIIVETVTNFYYEVQLAPALVVDIEGMFAALLRVTPAGINFKITYQSSPPSTVATFGGGTFGSGTFGTTN